MGKNGECGTETKLLTEGEAAEVLLAKERTLRKWRGRRRGPAYVKLGGKVRYYLADVLEFISRNRIDPSSAAAKTASYSRAAKQSFSILNCSKDSPVGSAPANAPTKPGACVGKL